MYTYYSFIVQHSILNITVIHYLIARKINYTQFNLVYKLKIDLIHNILNIKSIKILCTFIYLILSSSCEFSIPGLL